MSELNDILDLLDLAIGRSEGVLDERAWDRAGSLRSRLRVRDHYLEDALTVAFAGGTGTGKSSLVNAIVGAEVVSAGVLRPTTQAAVAVVPANLGGSIAALLDAVGVGETSDESGPEGRVLVDLPDYDSIERAHREIASAVVPNVDVVIWVADPEKYADPTVREQFLEPMLAYEDQFLFALNKVDLISEDVEPVVDHFRSILTTIGYASPSVVATAARNGQSGEADVEDLAHALAESMDTKRAALAKAALDIRMLSNEAWAFCHRKAVEWQSDSDALAASTFVSLGVAGYEMHARATDSATDRGRGT